MINLKNIVKVLLLALFICAYSGEGLAQSIPAESTTSGSYFENTMKTFSPSKNEFKTDGSPNVDKGKITATGKCPEGTQWISPDNSCRPISTEEVKNSIQDPTFCGSDYGIFNELVQTGQKIFKRLRDLIYVVAGFGIIAVAVGGFFGNLNWKWLGAIVISLVVVATAGELIVLMTGCEQFSSSLITNTLQYEDPMTTDDYNKAYMDDNTSYNYGADIDWDDSRDKFEDKFLSSNNNVSSSEDQASEAEQ